MTQEEILIDYLKKYHISELEEILYELSQLVLRHTTVTWNCGFGGLIISVGKVEEPVGEIKKEGRELEIEQAAILKNYKLPTMGIGFEQGAKWADEHPRKGLVDIDKMCEWLYKNMDAYACPIKAHGSTTWFAYVNPDIIKDFKKAMEE